MHALVFVALLAAADKADDRVLVYVDDVQPGDKSLASDANALTTSLCAAIGKEKRADVLCAPDVKQILNFAATAAMVGTSGGPGSKIQERLDNTKHVVSATFKKVDGKYVFVIKAGPKAADANAAALFSDKPVVALEERGDTQKAILEKIPSLAAKVNAALFAPVAAAATTAPPAPLADKDKKPASHGW